MVNALPFIPGQGLQGVAPVWSSTFDYQSRESFTQHNSGVEVLNNGSDPLPFEFVPPPELMQKKLYLYYDTTAEDAYARVSIWQPNNGSPTIFKCIPNLIGGQQYPGASFFSTGGTVDSVRVAFKYIHYEATQFATIPPLRFAGDVTRVLVDLECDLSTGTIVNHLYFGIASSN
jgi:hypothetical protein